MEYFNIYLFLVFSYLCGSFPSSLILAKILGKEDIRKYGSNNVGATNAVRVHGKLFGILVLILDIIKSIIPITSFSYLKTINISNIENIIYIISIITILGHVFPIWLKFKGGKAVASSIAIICILKPFIGFILITLWLITFFITKISALSALISFFIIGILSFFLYNQEFSIFIIIINIIIFLRHYNNIKDLLHKHS